MATVSVSPTPALLPTVSMSSRRGPLTSNPNVANSPLRGASALNALGKQKRSYANVQREELYGQPPPLKKQALERSTRSPSKIARPQTQLPQRVARPTTTGRVVKPAATSRVTHDGETDTEVWKKHTKAKFPQMVFYFDSVPDDIRAKLTKRVIYLGARQESFFSIEVTHVITGRQIPSERPDAQAQEDTGADENDAEQEVESSRPQTINPSLLDIDRTVTARRRLFDLKNGPVRSQGLNNLTKRNKAIRNNDVLHKAREMGKKIWSLDKFQNILMVLLDGNKTQTGVQGRQNPRAPTNASKPAQESNLSQLLHNERIHGPSDRDPTAVNREMTYFKGPFIYISDMDEKQKPIMTREYAKVANKADGEWPQFRSVGNGRCPFVEEEDKSDKERRGRQEERKREAKREAQLAAKAAEVSQPKPITGKRTLKEMEDGHNRARGQATMDVAVPAKITMPKPEERQQEHAFVSRVAGGRLFAGEPVASGLQGANITSAIRSQMVSSTSGLHGAKAGTSKEVHGLQRKVLQKGGPTTDSTSRRQLSGLSIDTTSARSATLSRETSKLGRSVVTAQTPVEEKDAKPQGQSLKSKKDLKPGYCENCQEKFRDFDEHILSRKHRKFAENDSNWQELDDLIQRLSRAPKFAEVDAAYADF